LDILDFCNDSAEPFDFKKNTLLGQFGKSKWQSYFELLHLPTSRLDTPKQEPCLAAGREATNGAVTPVPKVSPLPIQIFIHSKTLAMVCANFTIITPIGLQQQVRSALFLVEKTNLPLNRFRFSSLPHA
jgi:hypothetical protein